MSLEKQAISGVKWTYLAHLGEQGVNFVTLLILMRLLEPKDFGVLSMALVYINFFALFRDLGTGSAIVQRLETPQLLLSTVFFLNLLLGITFFALIFLSSPLVADLFQEPQLIEPLKLLSVSFLIGSFSVTSEAIYRRQLNFAALTKFKLIGVVIGAFVGITLALLGYGIWSLILQHLINSMITALLQFFSCSWKPSFQFCLKELRSIGNFSINLTAFNVCNYLARTVDDILIGRYYGADNLGYYTLAYKILLLPVTFLAGVIGRVMFPVLSKFQSDNLRFQDAYLRISGAIAFISFPAMLGLIVLANSLVLLILGEKWLPAVPIILVLAPLGLMQSIGSCNGLIYQAKGRTDVMFRWGLIASTVMIFGFIAGLPWGPFGVAVGYASAVILLTYPSFSISFGLIDLKPTAIFKVLKAPFFCSLIMASVVATVQFLLIAKVDNFFELSGLIVLGVIIYSVLTLLINREQFYELLKISGIKLILLVN